MSRATAWTLHLSVVVMAVTGLWLTWIVFLAPPPQESETEMFAVGDPWQPLLNVIHVVVAPVLIFAIGFIWREHVWRRIGFDNAQRRKSGVVLVLLGGPLVLGGYCLQVTDNETLRSIFGWTHAAAGALFATCYLVHLILRPPANGVVADG